MVLIVGVVAPIVVGGSGMLGEVSEETGDDDVTIGRAVADMRVTPPQGYTQRFLSFERRIGQAAGHVHSDLVMQKILILPRLIEHKEVIEEGTPSV
jgi:hypothetical protein